MADVTIRFKGDSSSAVRAGRQTEAAMGRVGGAGRRLGRALLLLSAAAGTALVVGLGKALSLAGDFEAALNTFQAVSEATADQMERVSRRAKELGADLSLPGTSAKDAADAMTQLAKGGLSVEEAMDAARGTIRLATAAEIENAAAATIVADSLKTFGLAGREADRVSDLLAAAANTTTAEIGDMSEALKAAGSVSAQLGVPIEDTVTALALFADAGIKGSDAGTALKVALIRLAAPTEKARDVLEDLNIQIFNQRGEMLPLRRIIDEFTTKTKGLSDEQRLQAANTIFGTRAIKALGLVLLAGTKRWDETAKAVGRQGAAAELAAAKMRGYRGALEAFKSVVETFAISVGQKLLPVATRAVEALAGLVEFLDKVASAESPTVAVRILFEGALALGGRLADALKVAILGETRRRPIRLPSGQILEWETVETKSLLAMLNEALEGLDWGALARNVASSFNDGLERIDWRSAGRTLGEAIREAIDAELDARAAEHRSFGQRIGDRIRDGLASVPGLGLAARIDPKHLRDSLERLRNVVFGFFEGLAPGVRQKAANAAKAIGDGFAGLPGRVRSLVARIPGAIADAHGAAAAAGGRLALAVARAILDGIRNLPARVGAKIGDIRQAIADATSAVFTNAALLGRAIVNGIVSGLAGLFRAVADKIASSVKGAIDWAKGHVGSTAAQYAFVQLGEPIMDGIAAGVARGTPTLTRALRQSLRRAFSAAGFERFSQIASEIFQRRQGTALTPAERAIAQIERRRQVADLQRAVAEATTAGERERAQEEIRLFELRERAEAERAALEQRQFLQQSRFSSALERLRRTMERDLSRAQERRALRRFVRQYRLNVNLSGLTLLTGDRQAARELARMLGPELNRAISYTVEAH